MSVPYRKRRRARLVTAFCADSNALRRELPFTSRECDGPVGRAFASMSPFASPDTGAEFAQDDEMVSRLALLPWIDVFHLHDKVHHWALSSLEPRDQWDLLRSAVEARVR